jgi:23S rRNA (guanine2445-N2)-methyltransferase / 23S rRNA (guanine2069-N7)-methyltransferase
MPQPVDLIATTAFGLEAVVRYELEQLGYESHVGDPGRIHFRGDLAAICRSNLWLRTADRILIQVATFPATDFEALFEKTKATPWHHWITADGSFPVVGRSIKSQLSSVPACQRAVKRAVVDSLLAGHQVAELPETGPTYKIEVALLKDKATLTIDTTGPSLHKRGYRKVIAAAPLKETLAAALVMLSFWENSRPLLDPFCGSGTIPIEAAMIGRRIAPGRQRQFAAMSWPNIPSDLWQQAMQEAQDLELPAGEERLIGTDADAHVLGLARQHAELAGVTDSVHFQQRPFEKLTSKREFGCLIANPPYGQRLDTEARLVDLYRSMPVVLRKLPTWSHFILTAFPNFESVLQKTADRRRKLYNGRIECTYYQFHGPKPGTAVAATQPTRPSAATGPTQHHSDPTAANTSQKSDDLLPVARSIGNRPQPKVSPAFGGLTEKSHEQANLFQRRLAKRARHLRRWPQQRGITCFRLYDRDIPEIPLVVDRYEDHLHITEYERPHDRDIAEHADWLEFMTQAASQALGIDIKQVFLKQRRRQSGARQHDRLGNNQYEITVQEGGLRFIVNLSDYVDTGLFLDHRITREMVRKAAHGMRVLNLFGYTGAFTVYAADGGASRTTTVDQSRPYLDWASRNLQLNDMDVGHHELVQRDALTFVRELSKKTQYDLVVIDPPTFSNSKSNLVDWKVQDHHAELINGILPHVQRDGKIFFSTNYRRFKLDAAAIASDQIREISRQTVPEDFRNRRIHRCWIITA